MILYIFFITFDYFQHLLTTTITWRREEGGQNKAIKILLIRKYVNYFFFFPEIWFFIMIRSKDLDHWPDYQSLTPQKEVYLSQKKSLI